MPDCPKAVKFQSSYQPHPCDQCEWVGYTPNHHAFRPIRKYCTHDPPPDGLLKSNGYDASKATEAQESWDLRIDEQSTCGYWLDREIGYAAEDRREEEREKAGWPAGRAVGIVDDDMMEELLADISDDEGAKCQESAKEGCALSIRRLVGALNVLRIGRGRKA